MESERASEREQGREGERERASERERTRERERERESNSERVKAKERERLIPLMTAAPRCCTVLMKSPCSHAALSTACIYGWYVYIRIYVCTTVSI